MNALQAIIDEGLDMLPGSDARQEESILREITRCRDLMAEMEKEGTHGARREY